MEANLKIWAEQQWGDCLLGDVRRTRRAVDIGRRMAAHPDSSLPAQMGDRATLLAAYRLLNHPHITALDLLRPHCQATLARCQEEARVLLIQDRTTLDYTAHPETAGLGPVGSRWQRGYFLQSALAVVPTPTHAQVLGIAGVELIIRADAQTPPPTGQRRGSAEGQTWENLVAQIGRVPANTQWVYVSDRESDIYEYLTACRQQGAGFVVRAYHNRLLEGEVAAPTHRLLDTARQWAVVPASLYTVEVAATPKTPKRTATVVVSWGTVTVHPPAYLAAQAPLPITVVRAWEPAPPSGVEAVEWVLLTSEVIATLVDAQRILYWYECRWLVEDLHQCLKTGCQIERSQLDHVTDLQRLLGFALPIAVRLLQLRQEIRLTPAQPAATCLEPLRIRLLAKHFRLAEAMTLAEFWKHVARLGGHLGRKADGPPGWRTLWRGWLQLEQWFYAATLVAT